MSFNSFSMTVQKFEVEYDKIGNDLDSRISLCIKQNRDIVKKPIKILKNAIRKEEYIEFIKDEPKALFFIDNFNLSKLTIQEEYRYLDLILKNCNKKNLEAYSSLDKNRQSCGNVFDELDFMRGLIFATKNYAWNSKTIKKVKNTIFDYLKFKNTADTTPLIHRLISLSLLGDMVNYGLIDNRYKREIFAARSKGEQKADYLRKEFKKELEKDKRLSNKNICVKFRKRHKMESQISKDIAADTKVLLAKIIKE